MLMSTSDPERSRICIFLRHGESETNVQMTWSDELDKFPLTERGELQTENAGRELTKLSKITSLYTSPILRARQTSDIVSKYIRHSPRKNSMLLERGFGKYNQVTIKSLEERRKVVLDQIRNNYPDWESWEGMIYRMRKFSEAIKHGEVVVAVSHRDPIKALISYFMGRREDEMFDVKIDNSSFTIVDFSKEGEKAILALNSLSITDNIAQKLGNA